MSATHSWLMPVAVNSRCTGSGAGRWSWSRFVVTHQPRRRLTPRRPQPHHRSDAVVARLDPQVSEFGLDAWHAIGGITGHMGLTDLLEQHNVGLGLRAGRPFQPVVVTAVRHAQRLAQRAHGKFGLVRLHEFVDDMDVFVFSLLPANQVVAFANMSRSC